MIQLILFLETILIVFWLEIEYHTRDSVYQPPPTHLHYNRHHSLDVVGNPILILRDIPENEKLTLWKESTLKYEMLSYFPDIQLMETFFKDRIEDNGAFKTDFLNHLREIHGDYIGAIITKEEFINAIIDPSDLQNS